MTLVDTGPLVALCDPHDRLHGLALTHLGRLAESGLRTCDAVLVEACFHLPHDQQRRRLARVLDDLAIDMLPTHEPAVRTEAFEWLIKYADHQPDYADACLAVLAGQDPRLKVWTYDREFRTTWRRPDGKPIPLAIRAT